MSRPVRIGDRMCKPPGTVAVNAEDGGIKSDVFVVSEEPRWHAEVGCWGVHNIRLDALWFADGVTRPEVPPPPPSALPAMRAELTRVQAALRELDAALEALK